MPEEVKELVRKYNEGKVTRREFIRQAVFLTGSLAVATSLIESLIPAPVHAAMTDPDDPALVSEEVKYTGKAGTLFGYMSRPKGSGPHPAIIIIHASRGLSNHIQDVTRRFAKEGYVALATDNFSRVGGTKKVTGLDVLQYIVLRYELAVVLDSPTFAGYFFGPPNA